MAVQVRHVDTWVGEGIISQDQADSICEFERRVTPSRGTAVEVLGYIGASMAVGATVVLVADIWDGLAWGSRFAILAVTSASMLIVGVLSASEEEPWVRRFGQVLMMLAVPLTAFASGVAASRWFQAEPSTLIGYSVAWLVSTPLYLRWRSSPQQVALFFAVIGSLLSLFMVLFDQGPPALPGAIALSIGAAWIAMATVGRIVPRLTGEILGGVAALIGTVIVAAALTPDAPLALAGFVALSGVAVARGVTHTRTPLIVIGMLGVVVYIPWFTADTIAPTFAAPLTLLAVGLTLTAIALGRARGN